MSAATQEPHSQRTQAICRVGTLAALAHSLLMEERFASSAQLRVKDGNASDVPQTCTNPARQASPASASLGCSKDRHRRPERREATARNVYNCDDRRIRTICMPILMSDINLYMVSLARQQRRSLTWPASTEHQRLGRVQSVSAWARARWLDSRLDAIWDVRRQPERGVGTFAFTLSTFPCGSGRRRAAARSWRLLRESESNGSQLTLDLSSIGNYVLLHHVIPRLAQHNLLSS